MKKLENLNSISKSSKDQERRSKIYYIGKILSKENLVIDLIVLYVPQMGKENEDIIKIILCTRFRVSKNANTMTSTQERPHTVLIPEV